MSLCNREASVFLLSVCLSVTFLRKSLLLPQTWLDRHQTCTRWSPHGPASGCAQGQGQGQRSRDMGTSVMSRNVCYTVPSDVLSLHALTLWSTVTLSFQYKCQAARCNVYIMEWATPSLTVWFVCLLCFVYTFVHVIDWWHYTNIILYLLYCTIVRMSLSH